MFTSFSFVTRYTFHKTFYKKNYTPQSFKKVSNRLAGVVLLSSWGQKNYPLRDPENSNLRDLAQATFEERI